MAINTKGEMKLFDRGDGVRGHYCIGRLIGNGPYHEFYNKSGWAGSGQLFTSKHAAMLVMKRLQKEQKEKA